MDQSGTPVAEEGPLTTEPDGCQPSGQEADSHASNLDKIRDILFGAQLQDLERRFAKLEQALLREAQALREDVRQRIEALEAYLRQQVEGLSSRLTQEQAVWSAEAATVTGLLERRSAEFEEEEERAARLREELQRHLADRTAELFREAGTRYVDSLVTIEQALTELRRQKLDRTAFAALLMDASLKLTPETAARAHE